MKNDQQHVENAERRRYKQITSGRIQRVENILEKWEEGDFESRLGTLHQSMDAPHKKSPHFEWNEGSGARYLYQKTGKYRRLRNAKAKKPKGKKYYRKARNGRHNAVYPPVTVSGDAIFQQMDYEEHMKWVHWRGGFYAYCKGCELPMPLRGMLNADMAVCYECADYLEWIEDWFLEDDLDREEGEQARLAS